MTVAGEARPSSGGPTRVLFVYYTFTQQARRVSVAMADTLREGACEVSEAVIELTDRRYAPQFAEFPWRHPFLRLIRMLPAQLRRATGEVRIPPEAASADYDLVIVGSPTWWLTMSMPIRSFMRSPEAKTLLDGTAFTGYVVCRRYWGNNLKTVKRLGADQGGRYLDGEHFVFAGGQVRSLLSLLSYMRTGENRERMLGVRIPPTNLQPDFGDQASAFARTLAQASTTPAAATP